MKWHHIAKKKLCACIKSHNPLLYMRMGLLENTITNVASVFEGYERCLFMNGATDGSQDAQRELAEAHGFGIARGEATNRIRGTTPGDGALWIGDDCSAAWAEPWPDGRELFPDMVIVFSDDDMLWKPDAAERLLRVWEHAPEDVVIISGLLEPEWPHSTPREAIDCGEEAILIRDTVPGAAWSFRLRDWRERIRPHIVTDFGYDSLACEALVKAGLKVGAIDVASHAGNGASTHDNDPDEHLPGGPVDKAKWRLR